MYNKKQRVILNKKKIAKNIRFFLLTSVFFQKNDTKLKKDIVLKTNKKFNWNNSMFINKISLNIEMRLTGAVYTQNIYTYLFKLNYNKTKNGLENKVFYNIQKNS